MFAEVYQRLPELDFELLGDASHRPDDFLDDYAEQKIRLMKFYALRLIFKQTAKYKTPEEIAYIKKR